MEAPLPPGYRELDQAAQESDKPNNIIGVVTDYLPGQKTKGTDWQVTFSIQSSEIGSFGSGHRVKVFAAQDKLPPLDGINDVVLIINIKMKDYRGSLNFLSNTETQYLVFPAKSMPEKLEDWTKVEYRRCQKAQRAKVVPDEATVRYAWTLWDFWKVARPAPIMPHGSSDECGYVGKQGFKLLENVGAGGFYELLGQVVKLYDQDGYGYVTLYLTDYTSNKLFYNYKPFGEAEARDGDEYGYISRQEGNWKGPRGQFTLAIDLWDSHAIWCRAHVKENDYVRLNNVQIAFGKEGGSKLEGKMRGDRNFPTKVNISKTSYSEFDPDEDVKELLVRKRDFIKQFGDWERGEEFTGKKRKRDGSPVGKTIKKQNNGVEVSRRPAEEPGRSIRDRSPPQQTKISKKQKKKPKRRLQAVQNAAENGAQGKRDSNLSTRVQGHDQVKPHHSDKEDDEMIPKPRHQIRMEYNRLNEHVATMHPSQPTLTVSQIITFPYGHPHTSPDSHKKVTTDYQTRMYATEARVVDFYPPNLRDFAIRQRISEFDCLPDDASDDNSSDYHDEPTIPHSQASSDHSSDSSESSSSEDELPPSSGLPPDTPRPSPLNSQPRTPSTKRHRWIWSFMLLLEERAPPPDSDSSRPSARLTVRVHGDGANFLLKGLGACDLNKQKNEKTLDALREKLFILWGNLQEKKEEKAAVSGVGMELSSAEAAAREAGQMGESTLGRRRPWRAGATNRPFQCCLREWGARESVEGVGIRGKKGRKVWRWRRRFGLFDTVIKG